MTVAITSSYTDMLFLFIWYSVEFIYMLSVIVYVSMTTGFPKRIWAGPPQEVVAPPQNPLAYAGSFVADAASIAKTLKETFNNPAPVAMATASPTTK